MTVSWSSRTVDYADKKLVNGEARIEKTIVPEEGWLFPKLPPIDERGGVFIVPVSAGKDDPVYISASVIEVRRWRWGFGGWQLLYAPVISDIEVASKTFLPE